MTNNSSSAGKDGEAALAPPGKAGARRTGNGAKEDRAGTSGSNSDGTSSGGGNGSSGDGSSGAVVKFRMPAVVAYADSRGHRGRQIGSQQSSSNLSTLTASGGGGGTDGKLRGNGGSTSGGSLSSEGGGYGRSGGQDGRDRALPMENGDGKSGSSLSQSSDGTGAGYGRATKAADSEVKNSAAELRSRPGGRESSSSNTNSSSDDAKPSSSLSVRAGHGGHNDAKTVTGSSEGAGTSGSNSRTSGSGSGSGSDNNGTSTSGGDPANVTASAGDGRATTSSGDDDRSSSGSGKDSSGPSGGNKSSGSGSDSRGEHEQQQRQGYYYGGAVPAPGQGQGQVDFHLQQNGDLQARQGPTVGSSGHVAVAADDAAAGRLRPDAYASLRHPSASHNPGRHHHHRHSHPTVPQGVDGAAQASLSVSAAAPPPVPSAVGSLPPPPQQQQQQQQQASSAAAGRVIGLRLPPSDEQAILQRVPRTHATVVAHDLPPPPTSSDAWSSSGSSGRGRKRSASNAKAGGTKAGTSGKRGGVPAHDDTAGQAAAMAQLPMVASVRLAHGGAVDSVVVDDGSRSSTDGLDSAQDGRGRGSAVHVTMDDPILKKRITLKGKDQAESGEKKKVKQPKGGKIEKGKPASAGKGASETALKRKIASMSRARPSSETDDAQAETGSGSAGSGSDEGYEGGSSERQSGGSGSDSISSSDGKKKSTAAANAASRAENDEPPKKVTTTVDSKRTETSSMSSSVLADFSSIMNEDGSIVLSRADSPGSSLSSNGAKNKAADGRGDDDEDDEEMLDAIGQNHLASTSGNKHKRTESSSKPTKSRKRSKDYFDGDAKFPGAMRGGLAIMERALAQKVRGGGHHHHYHSRSTGRKMLEENFLSAKAAQRDAELSEDSQHSGDGLDAHVQVRRYPRSKASLLPGTRGGGDDGAPDVYALGQDVMAIVCGFLDPVEVHGFLTQPLSKSWLVTYTAPQELWKILCTGRPFYAKLDEGESGSENSSTRSFPICNDLEMRHLFGRYRLLYTSFVRCMKYLNRLQDDALNGRMPSVPADADRGDIYPYSKNSSLKAYFAKARRLVRGSRRSPGSQSSSDAALSLTTDSIGSSAEEQKREESAAQLAAVNPSGVRARNGAGGGRRLGRSMITDRLLRPTLAGDVANVNLPWSCAIYSVVNWMVAFADVEGIQIMCLKCLPYLLEDESQRTTAQRAGLTDSVLRAMVLFPDSIELHTVAFHTLVLLARPLGGNEGMLFHTAMVNTRGIFNNGSNCSKNGIVIMLDSMRRFAQDEILQAMSCWSLVNVALTPLQKSMLVKLGGLTVTANAMLQHPYNAEVQFRALFALINLVIPSETRPESEEMREFEREIFQQLGEVGEISEKEMLDASVGQISNLVVVAMKNFCSSEAILNRACLVLHNLSLNEEYHSILLWTPNCYQMLEWCLGNYPHDHVLQQSAGGTIQRLNSTLSGDEDLRARLAHSIRAQQQHSLEQARQEAVSLQEQERDNQAMDLS